MIRFELRHERLELAQRLFPDLLWEDTALSEQLVALRQKKEASEREQAALREMMREMDPEASRKSRMWTAIFMGSLALLIVVSLSFVSFRYSLKPKATGVAFVSLSAFVILVGVFWRFRQAMLTNQFSKKFYGTLFVTLLLMLAHRSLAAYRGFLFSDVLLGDMLLISATLGASAISLQKRLWGGAVLSFLGAIFLALFPAKFLLVMGVTMLSLFMYLGYVAWKGE
ncbi:MAG: hypothetical protein H6728_17375 [Myxococcales bacterium]|nr:hypothetical protein [Myxococcales bacterium]MCB9644845.1 hypothetical protein [Myxococcales bacterium]